AARAIVHRQHLAQELAALLGAGLDNAPMLEAQADVADEMAIDGTGHRVAYCPLGGVLDGAGEELAAGKVALPVAVTKRSLSDRQAQIGVRAGDGDALLATQPVHVELLLAAPLAPALRRVLAVEEARL